MLLVVSRAKGQACRHGRLAFESIGAAAAVKTYVGNSKRPNALTADGLIRHGTGFKKTAESCRL